MATTVKANLQLIYVSDIERSTAFYKDLLNDEPVMEVPRYVAFGVEGKALFALWSGAEAPQPGAPAYSEIGIMVPTGEDVDRLYVEWQERLDLDVVLEPVTEVFGRTFMIRDPDGHLIRVSPLD